MNSITNVVQVKYGRNDVPEPLFQCPVVVDPKIVQVLKGTETRVAAIVSEAACAVELVSRFEGWSRYVDFASRLNVASGERRITVRVQLVRGRMGNVVRIDFSQADQRVYQ
jgi:hypothetical protein